MDAIITGLLQAMELQQKLIQSKSKLSIVERAVAMFAHMVLIKSAKESLSFAGTELIDNLIVHNVRCDQ